MSFFRSLLAASGLILAATLAHAQAGVGQPARGITMEQVEKQFGSPKQVIPAVGDPPIVRWVYDAYTVYFEHNRVLHAVSNEKQPTTP